jgi:structural maintenance of chromosome 3 (chondroitin sulfate proteoglycan 6)
VWTTQQDAGGRATKADVTVVFDNSDKRLSTASIAGGREEVSIRRVVGAKKDEHFINDKSVSRSDVQSLLEAAGFSRHNPYFMVEQGKVTDLSVMRDDARMELLKRVAGTDVYEQRRKESLKILADTERKRKGIEEVIAGIDGRLAELESEREELEEYSRLDQQRRALQYTLHQRQLEGASQDALDYEQQLGAAREKLEAQQTELDETRASIDTSSRTLAELEGQVAELKTLQEDLMRAKADAMSLCVAAGTRLRSLEEDVARDSRSQEEIAEALKLAEKEVEDAARVVAEVKEPAVAAALERHREAHTALRALRTREEVLLGRQGRASRFKTAKQRDAWLDEETTRLSEAAEARESDAAAARKEASRVREEAARASAVAQELQHKAVGLAEALESDLKPRIKALQASEAALSRDRVRVQNDLAAIERDLRSAMDQQQDAESRLWKGVPAAVRIGLEEAKRMVLEEGLEGVHGPLVELIRHPLQVDVAVEQVAGNRLFSLVVDDEVVAAKIVRHLQTLKRGRVTCMPLRRLRPPNPTMPNSREHPDVKPLISLMEFPDAVSAAVKEVFGGILLCKDADVASKYASPVAEGGFGVDCVTPDGYKRDADGSVFGGYVDMSATRTASERARRSAGRAVTEAEEARGRAREAAGQLDRDLSKCRSDLSQAESERHAMNERMKQLRVDAEMNEQVSRDASRRAAQFEATIESSEQEAVELREQAAALGAERGTPLNGDLGPAERAELLRCSKDAKEAADRNLETLTVLEEARAGLAEAQGRLDEQLRPAVEDLRKQLSGKAGGTGGGDVERRLEQLEEAKSAVQGAETRRTDAEQRLAEVESQLGERGGPLEELRAELEELRSAEQRQQEALRRLQAGSDTLWRQRAQALETRTDCEGKLRELGTLPGSEMAGLEDLSRSEVMKRLKSVGKQLTKYSSVNKKALRQWQTFSAQRAELQERREESDRGDESIHATISHLDREKDKAILRTFRGVARHFREVFRELVPHGEAQMLLVCEEELGSSQAVPLSSQAASSTASRSVSHSREIESDSQELEDLERRVVSGVSPAARPMKRTREGTATEEEDERSELDQYKGIRIKARFARGEAPKRIELYSGGQKTMIAIALLFAIQRCDPAPFYLFDEVDQALDSTYRTALADLIKKQAADEENPAQFLTISFRTEVINAGDRHFVLEPGYTTRMTYQTPATALEIAERICEDEAARGKHAHGRRVAASEED